MLPDALLSLLLVICNWPSCCGSRSVLIYDLVTDCGAIVRDTGSGGLDGYLKEATVSSCDAAGLNLSGGDSGCALVPLKIGSAAALTSEIRSAASFTLHIVGPLDLVARRQGTPESPRRILSLGRGPICPDEVDLLVGQAGCDLVVRLVGDPAERSSGDCQEMTTTVGGILCSEDGMMLTVMHNGSHLHVFDHGTLATVRSTAGSLRAWRPEDPLAIGNELTLDRAWGGHISMISFSSGADDQEDLRTRTEQMRCVLREARQALTEAERRRATAPEAADDLRRPPDIEELPRHNRLPTPVRPSPPSGPLSLALSILALVALAGLLGLALARRYWHPRRLRPHARRRVIAVHEEPDSSEA